MQQKVVLNLENPVSFPLITMELHILNVLRLIMIDYGVLQTLIVIKITSLRNGEIAIHLVTKVLKVFILTRFVFIHFVCTFYIDILGNKIDLEIPSGLAWCNFVKYYHATLLLS